MMAEAHVVAPRFLDAGDAGLVVEFGQDIDEATNLAVLALTDRLGALDLDGVIEIIPTYRSLLVQFDPLRLGKQVLIDAISRIPLTAGEKRQNPDLWHIPVCYGGEHGVDLATVAQANGLGESEVVARHTAVTYRIYMIGFAPGFAYLGGLDRSLHTSRRTEPRQKTPPRSISIGGMQTALSPPIEIPSGWHMVGQTGVRTYDPQRTARPFLFGPGDYLRFHSVTPAEYEKQLKAAEDGAIVATREDFHD